MAPVLWLVALVVSIWLLGWHTTVTTDLTALLPASAGRIQQLLVDQLRDGVASRLILIGLEGGEPQALADASRHLARRLKDSDLFSYVNNGEAEYSGGERDALMRRRYLLSPSVTPEQFTAEGLREALQDNLRRLGSPVGAVIKSLLPSDPTGEFVHILSRLSPDGGPSSQHGVWFSRDGARAQLVAGTRAPGFDLDQQQAAIETIRRAFAGALLPAPAQLLISGPGVFAVESRAVIERDSWRLSAIAGAVVIVILLSVYRSIRIVLLSLLPVVSGLLVGIAAVGLVFGSVHGITLGFGATLIGEAVDYPTYLFTHVAPGESVRETLRRMWPTLRLAVLTTVFGGLTMLLSSFRGLSQLGLLSVTGVLVAGLVTRWVLPSLAPDRGIGIDRRTLSVDWTRAMRSSRYGRWLMWCLLAASLIVMATRHAGMWDDDLANLSPVSESAKALDQELRAELGAPDVRYLVMVTGNNEEEALTRSESIAGALQGLVERHLLAEFDMAAHYLPSRDTQSRRRAALPQGAALRAALKEALRGLPFREDLFEPFLREVEQARTGALIDLADWQSSALSLKIRSLLLENGHEWTALVPLRGVSDGAQIAARISELGDPHVVFLDLKEESNQLVNGYRHESLRLTSWGILAIAAILWWGLRDLFAVGRVLAPVLMAVVMVVAVLILLGERLNLFHLVSLLLVIGIGLNYALFFNRDVRDEADTRRTVLSLMVCSMATLSAFGALAFSRTPVLHAIGLTVGLGCLFSLFVSAVLAKAPAAHPVAMGAQESL